MGLAFANLKHKIANIDLIVNIDFYMWQLVTIRNIPSGIQQGLQPCLKIKSPGEGTGEDARRSNIKGPAESAGPALRIIQVMKFILQVRVYPLQS